MLEEILIRIDWTEVVYALIVAALGVAALYYRKRVPRWIKFWSGVFSGLREIPDMRMELQGIRHYVAPNGGGSLMDAVQRTEATIVALSESVDIIIHTMRAEDNSDYETARFDCSEAGGNTYINLTYARWLGASGPELMGWNFLNFIHPDDVAAFQKLWDSCREQHRQFRHTYRMVTAAGATLHVRTVATPIPDGPPIKRWVGVMRKTHND